MTSARAPKPTPDDRGQRPPNQQDSDNACRIPPALDPSFDGRPSAQDQFGSNEDLDVHGRILATLIDRCTITYDDLRDIPCDKRWEEFKTIYINLAETAFRQVHGTAVTEWIDKVGCIYTWEGSNKDLKPIMFLAHTDVAPVDNEKYWTHPPFRGFWDGEWVWGRGATGNKSMLLAIMAAMEQLLCVDYAWKPSRTIVFAITFDGESPGQFNSNSRNIKEHLMDKYGHNGFALILTGGDAGFQVFDNVMYALPAVSDRGYLDISMDLSVTGQSDSSSQLHNGIEIVSEIVHTINAHKFPPKIIKDSPTHRRLLCQAHYSPEVAPELTKMLLTGDLGELHNI